MKSHEELPSSRKATVIPSLQRGGRRRKFPKKSRSSVSTVIATILFIAIILSAFSVMWLVFGYYNNYNMQLIQYDEQTMQQKETSFSISGLSFKTPSSYSAPSTVGTSTSQLATSYSHQGKVFYSQGLWWVFYSDGSNIVYRTSSNGQTWSGATIVTSSPGSAYGDTFSAYQSGNTVYYVLGSPDSARQFRWRYGTFGSNGAISWAFSEITVTTSNNVNYHDSIVVDSSGNVWVAIDELQGANTHSIEIMECPSGTCTTWTSVNRFTGLSADSAPILLATTPGILLVYGQTASSTQQVCITTPTGANCPISPPSYYYFHYSSAISNGSTIYFAGLASSSTGQTTGTVKFWSYTYGAGSTSSEKTLDPNTATWVVSISQVSNSFVVFYGSGANLYYVYSTDSGLLWTQRATISTSETAISGVTALNSEGGVAWVSGSGSPYNVRFASASVSWQLSLAIQNSSPFAVHLVSLYLYDTNTDALAHFDVNPQGPGVVGQFELWVPAGEAINSTISIVWIHSQNYLITIATDEGVLFSNNYVSPP
jgi:hypothetical protein